MRIYGDLKSGNCWKVKTLADRLELPHDWVEVDLARGDTRTAEFLRRNPAGQVPVVEFEDGRCLAQSNAILLHLGRASRFVPTEPFAEAKMLEWLFWEQYSHEPYVAVCRFHMVYAGGTKATRDPAKVARGEAALDLMERQLAGRDWLVDDPTLADLALVAYTRVAEEGGFDLAARPALRDWIARSVEVFEPTAAKP